MLLSISVKNYAIIDNISIDFSDGLNVLTGETGAGKSIIVGALSLALGYRSDLDSIRKGADKMSIKALFDFDKANEELKYALEKAGIDSEDESLLLSREIYLNGRNICKINDQIVSVNTLKVIGTFLVDIHGQHEHQKLLNSKTHISFLDAYGANNISLIKNDVKDAYDALKKAKKDYDEILVLVGGEKEKRDEYIRQITEIEEIDLSEGLDEKLEKRRNVLFNAQKIYEYVDDAYSLLYSNSSNISQNLAAVENDFENILHYDSSLLKEKGLIDEARILLDEAVMALREYRLSLEFEPEELDEIEEKLHKIKQLKRKYGEKILDIIEYKENIKRKLSLIENSEIEVIKYKSILEQKRKDYLLVADKLTRERKSTAKKLEEELMLKLSLLAMAEAKFNVSIKSFNEDSKFSKDGVDEVSFLISTNKGQDLKALSKIASGGEISRIMLAFKSILAEADKTETLIFDEIDTGISGRTAQVVSEQLYELSKSHQLLCITHLPQIACMAEEHFLIKKCEVDGNTLTEFTVLESNERESEIARMLSGVEVTSLTLSNAKEMITLADDFKSRI